MQNPPRKIVHRSSYGLPRSQLTPHPAIRYPKPISQRPQNIMIRPKHYPPPRPGQPFVYSNPVPRPGLSSHPKRHHGQRNSGHIPKASPTIMSTVPVVGGDFGGGGGCGGGGCGG